MRVDYPRVAIVSSNPLRDDTGNGILMRSLFRGWPRERLAQVYFQVVVPHLPNCDDCHQYRVIQITGTGRRVDGADGLGAERGRAAAAARPAAGSGRRLELGRALQRKAGLFSWLRSAYELWTAMPWMSGALERQLRELRPDIVYALLGTYSLTRITTIACARLGLPLFVHVVDDFVTSLYEGRPLASRIQAASKLWFQRAVRRADGQAAISPLMAEEFGRRYGGTWSWFTTLIGGADYDPSPRRADGTIRLVFAGNLALARWRSLRAVALALARLRERRGIESRLVICASTDQLQAHRAALDVPPITDLRGWVPPDQLPGLFHDADVLVHVESFEASFASYASLSFSTKLSQYMMAGRCILAFAPAELGSVQVMQSVGAAFAITEDSAEVLEAGLGKLLTNAAARNRMAERGRAWAIKHVDRGSGEERFRREMVATLGRARRRSGDVAVRGTTGPGGESQVAAPGTVADDDQERS